MIIDRIYINTHRYDLSYTRICLASIRYWYPNIPISLIVDHSNGDFVYSDILKKWNVDVLNTGGRKYGWGLGKFEPLFLPGPEKFLVVDADTVMIGSLLDKIIPAHTDFVVDREEQPSEKLSQLYYNLADVEKLAPGFKYPGYSFNTGQWAGTTGRISMSDLEPLIDWGERPKLKYPAVFKQADQGLFNFLIHDKENKGLISVTRVPLMLWPPDHASVPFTTRNLKERNVKDPIIIHWAGIKFKRAVNFPLIEIASFYEDYFYSRYSSFRKTKDRLTDKYLNYEKHLRHRIKKSFS